MDGSPSETVAYDVDGRRVAEAREAELDSMLAVGATAAHESGDESSNGLEQSGLAGSVRADEGYPVAAGGSEGDILKSGNTAIRHSDIINHQFVVMIMMRTAVMAAMIFSFQGLRSRD